MKAIGVFLLAALSTLLAAPFVIGLVDLWFWLFTASTVTGTQWDEARAMTAFSFGVAGIASGGAAAMWAGIVE